ncbi:MAG TPA: ATP-binding protein [Elusimicrobiota bacterium]|nr:ATP-binding protein [Elusimicrobiota bacterium]
MNPQELDALLTAKEGDAVEFKEAKARFDFDELTDYCVAIANEGGGKVVLGVTDKRPRKVVGTQAFPQPERTLRGLLDRIPLRLDFFEVKHPEGRVLVFEVPSRPLGIPLERGGKYWMRRGDSLVPMSPEKLWDIFAESGKDFSSGICPGLTLDGLDPAAIDDFRKRWTAKTGRSYDKLSTAELLKAAEVLAEGGVTYAGLILFGKPQAVRLHLPQAEIIFEYRSSEAAGSASYRKDYRQGFFAVHQDIWNTVNLRNDAQHYQDGLFVLDIATFDERTVREAVLNAVAHRDYQMGGSIFLRQYQRRLLIENPGGLPLGVTPENIIDRQAPRNRLIMDVLLKCGLVEKSGQGVDLMFERSIQQGKSIPDFTGTDRYLVKLTLYGQVQDERFLRFLERVGKEKQLSFGTQDLLALDLVHREQAVPETLQARLHHLLEQGVVERFGRGKGTRHILSRRFYAMAGKKGVYTRKRGLDRATNKELLLKHIKENAAEGSRLRDLLQVLPGHTRPQVQSLLRELVSEGSAHCIGKTNAALWYPGVRNQASSEKQL